MFLPSLLLSATIPDDVQNILNIVSKSLDKCEDSDDCYFRHSFWSYHNHLVKDNKGIFQVIDVTQKDTLYMAFRPDEGEDATILKSHFDILFKELKGKYGKDFKIKVRGRKDLEQIGNMHLEINKIKLVEEWKSADFDSEKYFLQFLNSLPECSRNVAKITESLEKNCYSCSSYSVWTIFYPINCKNKAGDFK